MAGTTGIYQHVILGVPSEQRLPVDGSGDDRRSEVWDNGDALAARARARARAQPRHRARRRPRLRERADLGLVLPRRATTATRSTPWAMARCPPDEHGAQARARTCCRPRRSRSSGATARITSRRMETLTRHRRAPAHPEARAVATTTSSTAAPIGTFDSQAPALRASSCAPRRSGARRAATAPDTLLIDMHPATRGDWSDAAMDVGQTFSDPIAGVTIKNVGQDASGATLAITAPKDVVPPSAPSGLTAIASGTSAVLHWTAATDDYQVDSYVVTRDGDERRDDGGHRLRRLRPRPGQDRRLQRVGDRRRPERRAACVGERRHARHERAGGARKGHGQADARRQGAPRLGGSRSTTARSRTTACCATAARSRPQARSPTSTARRRPGSGRHVTYSVVAIDLAGNAGPAGRAPPLRSALLRRLAASALRVTHVRARRATLRVRGKLSDASARCRLRVGSGRVARLQGQGRRGLQRHAAGARRGPVTLSLRDSLGRVNHGDASRTLEP